MALLDAADTPAPSAPDAAAPVATPAPAAATDEGTPAETPGVAAEAAEQKIADLTDDTLVKVIVDGEEVLKPWKEAKSELSGRFKFTSEMQRLATERKAVTAAQEQQAQQQQALAQLQQERNQLAALLQNPQLLQQYAQQVAQPQAPTAESVLAQLGFNNQDEIVTVADAMKIAQHLSNMQVTQATGALQHQFQQAFEQLAAREAVIKQDIRDAQETESYISSLNDTFTETLKANPILSAVPQVEELIRYEVSRMNPATLEDAQDAIQKVAGEIVESLNQRFIEQNKSKVIAKQKLATQTIEPPVGTGVQPQPIQAVDSKTGKVNWDQLRKQAESYL